MRFFNFLLLLLLCTYSFIFTHITLAEDGTSTEQLVRDYYRLFYEASESDIERILHKEYTLVDKQLGVIIEGRELFKKIHIPGGHRDYPVEFIKYVGDDKEGGAHARLRWRTRNIAPAWGLTGDDTEITFEGFALITFRDGKIFHHLDFWDSGLLYQKLGGEFPNPDPGKFGVKANNIENE